MQDIHAYISSFCIEEIRSEIKNANGNEIFILGKTNKDRLVEEIIVLARGNRIAVPAVRKNSDTGDVVIHNHPSGILTPSTNDTHISTELAQIGIGSYIVNNGVDDIYVVIEPFDRDEEQHLNDARIMEILKPGGIISHKLVGYEYRPQQLEMVRTISNAFNKKTISVVEAGTGVGKSLAYLIPAIYWSVKNKEKCVISTNTINLQEQLVNKDIPFLKSVLSVPFKAVLVKGRNNYVCQRKISELNRDPELMLEFEEKDEVRILIDWAHSTKDGSKSDLNFIPKYEIWDKIAADSDTCTRSKCPFFRTCFVNVARREANKAHLLIVNHYLLFADLAVRNMGAEIAVLPQYKRLILDEAHHVEDVATNYLGGGITRAGINRILSRLHHIGKSGSKGSLSYLRTKLLSILDEINDDIVADVVRTIEAELIPTIDILATLNNEAMGTIFNLVSASGTNEFGEIKLRLTRAVKEKPLWESVLVEKFKVLIYQIRRFSKKVAAVLEKLDNSHIEFDETVSSVLIENIAQLSRLVSAAAVIEEILFEEDEKNIRWFEAKSYGKRPIIRLKISPLEIVDVMKSIVYDKFDTIIMTSATLTVTGLKNMSPFDYLNKRLGLNHIPKSRLRESSLPPNFDYKHQTIVGIPTDVALPESRDFRDSLVELIKKSVKITVGKAFILFTSYGLLNYCYNQLRSYFQQENIMALKQGSENRYQLLEMFKKNTSSVLLGTDSFWEGVDVQGEALENVIITKLPFKVPTEPVIEARIEAIKKRGGNAFMEYSVPQAVIKLKQGFGRLIRSKTDRGCVLIFDKRIIEKFYGKIFVSSLPECPIIRGPQDQVFKEITTFFENNDKYDG